MFCFPRFYLSQKCRSSHNHLPLILKILILRCSTKAKKARLSEKVIAPERLQKLFKPEILRMFPSQFFRKCTVGSALQMYLANESETAMKIANYFETLPNPNIPFIETNPGPGLLTKFLIQSKMKDIRIFEGNKEFMTHLDSTYAKPYPGRVTLKQADVIGLYKYTYADRMDKGKRVEDILRGLPVTEWEDDINFRLYGATGSLFFFRHLINSIIFQQGILSFGRCEFYIVVPSIIYFQLAASNKAGYRLYRSLSILFQIFFEYEVIDKFPSIDFLPHSTRHSKIKFRIHEVEPDVMYFLRIVPRRDLHKSCPQKHIQEMWFFIKLHCSFSRSKRVIPSLEKLIPGCGARLFCNIEKPVTAKPIYETNLNLLSSITSPSMTLSTTDYYQNFHIFTEFGDLEPSQLLTLFHQFLNWPEYSQSHFLPTLEMILLKMETSVDEIPDIVEQNFDKMDNSLHEQLDGVK